MTTEQRPDTLERELAKSKRWNRLLLAVASVAVLGLALAWTLNWATHRVKDLTDQETAVKLKQPAQDDEVDITVYITRTGAKYHRGSCGYLRQSSIPIALKNAKARGYTPCSRCRPPR